jgi:hypothetical protein
MQASGTAQPATAAAEAHVAAALAQARAAIDAQSAEQLRDQAADLRAEAQALRDAARVGTTIQVQQHGPNPRQEKMIFVGFVIFMIAAVVILQPLARAFARRLEGGGGRTGTNKLDNESRDQLQRMEQSIDAMAIEIERISEGQRFTTKLLSGREEAMLPVGDARRQRPS